MRRTAARPSYSARLVQPFASLLAQHSALPAQAVEEWHAVDPDARVPIAVAHELLSAVIGATGDEDLGLRAGRAMKFGDGGALDYAMGSACSVRAAFEAFARYLGLVNDALSLRIEIEGGRAHLHLDSHVVLPRAAEDFMVSALFHRHVSRYVGKVERVECWLLHAAPASLVESQATFAPAVVRFAAPHCGFVLPVDLLDEPIASSDPNLHCVIRQYAERVLAEMPMARSLTETLRQHLAQGLAQEPVSAAKLAQRLGMSTRTLGRRLQAEGTTYALVLDDLRKRLALQYLGTQEVGVSEVAFLLGFAHAAAFHRAFRRWTGQTPLEYRRAQARASTPPVAAS